MAGLRGYHSVLVSIFVFIVLTLILCSKNVKLFVKKQRAVGVLSAPRREGRGNGSRIDIHLVSTIYISPPPQTSDTAATAQYQQRRKEHITCLHRNLKHPLVRKYYLFTDKDDAKIKDYLQLDQAPERAKIVHMPFKGLRETTYKIVFKYITENLKKRLVVFMGSDNYLGEGFEKVDVGYLKRKQVVYVLTRSGRQEAECLMTGNCRQRYLFSHDAYIMVPTFTLNAASLDWFAFPQHQWGAENIVIYILRRVLRLRVLNPCRILKVYHYHCSGYRPQNRTRLTSDSRSRWFRKHDGAPFSGLYA